MQEYIAAVPLQIGNAPAPLTITHWPKYTLTKILWDCAGLCFFGWLIYSNSKDPHTDWFGLVFPAFAEVGAILALLYLLSGRTQLEFSHETLAVKIVIMGVPRRTTYLVNQMGEPYWTEVTDEGDAGPRLEFDYNGRDVKACWGITAEEVDQAVAAIRGLYPGVARRWDKGTPLRSKVFTTLGLS